MKANEYIACYVTSSSVVWLYKQNRQNNRFQKNIRAVNNKKEKEIITNINKGKYSNRAMEEIELTYEGWNNRRLQRKRGQTQDRDKTEGEEEVSVYT